MKLKCIVYVCISVLCVRAHTCVPQHSCRRCFTLDMSVFFHNVTSKIKPRVLGLVVSALTLWATLLAWNFNLKKSNQIFFPLKWCLNTLYDGEINVLGAPEQAMETPHHPRCPYSAPCIQSTQLLLIFMHYDKMASRSLFLGSSELSIEPGEGRLLPS